MPISSQIHISQPLTNIAVNYMNTGYIASKVFPYVPVKKTSDKYFVFDKDFRLPTTTRGNRAESRIYDFKMSNATYSLVKHGLKGIISDDDKDNFDLGDLQVRMTEKLKDKILLRMEYDVAGLFTSTSWSNNVTLAATQQFSSDTATSNPVPIFDTGTTVVLNSAGIAPNFGIIPKEVLMKIKNHSSIIERVKYTSEVIDEKVIAGLLGIKELLVPSAQIETTAEGATTTATISNVWGDNCFVGYKASKPAVDEVSCGYVFISRDPQVKTWREEEIESDVIEVNTKYQAKVVASLAGYLIKDCLA